MLSGRDVKLRAWQEEDLRFFHQLRNDVTSQLPLMGDIRPQTLVETRDWLENRTRDRDQVFFCIEKLAESRLIGFVELRSIRSLHRHASLGIYLAAAERGQGRAAEALELVTRYASDVIDLRKIIIHVLANHTRAIRLYERSGFERVGIHRSHFYYGGNFHDVLIMEKILARQSQDALAPWMQ